LRAFRWKLERQSEIHRALTLDNELTQRTMKRTSGGRFAAARLPTVLDIMTGSRPRETTQTPVRGAQLLRLEGAPQAE
jgi:hypothetical protein